MEEGAEVNAKNDRGRTALYVAVRCRKRAVAYFLLEHGAVAVISDNQRRTPLDWALHGVPDVALICKMLLPSGALVQLAMDAAEAHEKRLKRLKASLKRAVENPGFLSDLADTLAGIDASGCARGNDAMLAAMFQQLDA